MDVATVAIATVVSQALSAGLTVSRLLRRTDACALRVSRLSLKSALTAKILSIGIPVGLQCITFDTANVVAQSLGNSFGKDMIAGSAAAANIEGIVSIIMSVLRQ